MTWNIDTIALTLAVGALHGDPDPFAVIVPMRGLQSNNDDINPAAPDLPVSFQASSGSLPADAIAHTEISGGVGSYNEVT